MKKIALYTEKKTSDAAPEIILEIVTPWLNYSDIWQLVIWGLVIYIEKLRQDLAASKDDPAIRSRYDTFFMQVHDLIDKAAKL